MSQAEPTTKPKRAQLKHLLLDVNFKDKPKVIELEAIHSPLARLLYIDIQATMSAATDGKISKKVPLVLGSRIGLSPDQVNSIIDFCLQTEMLIEEDGLLTSKRVIEDQEKLYKEQERWRQNREKHKTRTDITISYARAEHVPEARKSEILNTEDLNIDLKKNSAPEPEPKYLQIAEASLIPKSDPRLNTLNDFITMGRRPMRKYPIIKLTEHELADILEQFEQSGIPIDERRIFESAFKNVAGRLKTKASGGALPAGISAYNWLIGFAKTDLLREYKASLDVKRSETYLEKARV